MTIPIHPEVEPLIDVAAAARILHVSSKTVTRMALREEIPAMRIGRLWRFRASVLDEWMRSKMNTLGVESAHSPCPVKRSAAH